MILFLCVKKSRGKTIEFQKLKNKIKYFFQKKYFQKKKCNFVKN